MDQPVFPDPAAGITGCPKCGYDRAAGHSECPRCGVIFAKYQQRSASGAAPAVKRRNDSASVSGVVRTLLFYVPDEVNPVTLAARALLLAILALWGTRFIFTPIASAAAIGGFWHMVNLPFHEAGHILFRPFGALMTSMGGSIFQVLMPLICLAVFLVKTRDPFAGAFCLWWAGQNFIDLAPYINDARSLSMPLLGGNVGSRSPYGFHDWEFILTETGLLRFDHAIARLSHATGALLIMAAIVWGAVVLIKQYRVLRR